MPQTMPFVPRDANYSVDTVLAGKLFTFDVRWNARAGAWYMNVLDDAGVMIRAGLKLVLGSVIGGLEVDPRFPDGIFQAADMSGRGVDAGFDDLGVRVQIIFYPFSEFEAGV